jgi:hypothetical protein
MKSLAVCGYAAVSTLFITTSSIFGIGAGVLFLLQSRFFGLLKELILVNVLLVIMQVYYKETSG